MAAKYSLLSIVLITGLSFWVSLAAADGGYNSAADEKQGAQESILPSPEQDGAKSFTVTSVDKCYAQLSREDALDIQKNYTKPYQECQRRLALKLKNEKWSKNKPGTKTGDSQDSQPKNPENFYRVQKKEENKTQDADQKKQETPPVSQEKVPLN
jgi:hypothetical protein